MFVKSILWLDKASREAEIKISDGNFDILCYSCPCDYLQGDKIILALECLDIVDIMISSEEKFFLKKEKEYFSYSITGKVYDVKQGVIGLGKIKLHIDSSEIPKDIVDNQYITFKTSRIDLW